jgi:large subunit ribosomal protein L15
MRLHDLQPAKNSHRDRKRLGRGNATGQGTTAGKGTKGEKARSGGLKAGFRGMSSRNQRMAKRRGFTNVFKVEHEVVNLDQLGAFESGATVDLDALKQAGLVDGSRPVKVLARGTLSTAINLVEVPHSASARTKIEAAGGTVTWSQGQATPEA